MTALELKHRFQLPANWSPAGTRCVVFTIPDDPEYFGQIIGLVDALKFSNNFGRDPTKIGAATVSRTWQAALESQPVFSLENCEVEDMTFERRYERPKPGEPWITQHRYAGETAWRDAHIQANWSGQSADIPDASDWLPAQTEAGEMMRGWHMFLARQFADGLTAGLTKVQTVDMIMGKIAPTTDNYAATRQAVEDTYDMVSDLPTPTATMEEFAEDECKSLEYWQTAFNAIHDKADNWINEIADYLETRQGAEMFGEPFNREVNKIAQTLIPKKWREFWRDQQQIPGESAFAAECEWIHTIDFAASMSPFFFNASYPDQPTWPAGMHDPGVGIKSQNVGPQPEDLLTSFSIDFFFKYDTEITRIITTEIVTEQGANRNLAVALDNDELCQITDQQTGWGMDATVNPTGNCTPPHTRMRIFGFCEFGDAWLTTLIIRGNGPNPFGTEEFEL